MKLPGPRIKSGVTIYSRETTGKWLSDVGCRTTGQRSHAQAVTPDLIRGPACLREAEAASLRRRQEVFTRLITRRSIDKTDSGIP